VKKTESTKFEPAKKINTTPEKKQDSNKKTAPVVMTKEQPTKKIASNHIPQKIASNTVSTPVKKEETSKKDEPPKKIAYIICDRCELNYYIPSKKDKFCKVCAAELGYADRSLLIADEEELEKPCPMCKTNILAEDEEICFLCVKEKAKIAPEEEKDWSAEEPEKDEEIIGGGEIEISLEGMAEEEREEEDDDLANVEPLDEEPDDFDFDVDPNDFEGDENEEFVEDEDEEDGEDDEDDEF